MDGKKIYCYEFTALTLPTNLIWRKINHVHGLIRYT